MSKLKFKIFNLPSRYDDDVIIISVVIRVVLFFVLYLPTIFFFSKSDDIFRLLTIYGFVNIFNMIVIYFFKDNLTSFSNNAIQILLICLEILIESYVVYSSGGIVSNFTILYIYTIISAAILFNIIGALSVTFIISVLYVGIYFLQSKRADIGYILTNSSILKIYYFNITSFISIAILTGVLSKKIKLATQLLDEKNKMAIVGDMSSKLLHEIKNPLSAILGSAQMLQNNKILSKDRLYGLIYKEAKRIDYLMRDFFDVLKKKEPVISRFNIVKLINDIVILYGEDFRSKYGINYIFNGPQNGIDVESDINMLEQIVVNLYRNALQVVSKVKDGVVEVNLVDNKKSVFIEFKDNGGGIPDEIFDKILMPFISTNVKGTGLGLAVVNNLCEILDIDFNFKNINYSDNRKGAVFSIIIDKKFNKE